MYKLTPSGLANYQFKHNLAIRQADKGKRQGAALTYEEMLEMVTPTEPNDAMRIGSSVHDYLETGEQSGDYSIADTTRLDQLRSIYCHDDTSTEVRMQRAITTPWGDAVVSGMADVLMLDKGIDWKVSTKKRNAEKFFNSAQAFCYLWLFDVERFDFVTLKAVMPTGKDYQPNVIKRVEYGNTISVPRTNQTEHELLHWIIQYMSDLQKHELLNKIAL